APLPHRAQPHAAKGGHAPAPAAVVLQAQPQGGALDRQRHRAIALELAPQPSLARLGLLRHLLGVALELRGRRATDGVLGVLRLPPRGGDVGLQASSSLLLGLVVERELRPPALALGAVIALST